MAQELGNTRANVATSEVKLLSKRNLNSLFMNTAKKSLKKLIPNFSLFLVKTLLKKN